MTRLRLATVLGLLGALAVIVGTVLPWITLTTPGMTGQGLPSFEAAQSQTFNGLFAGNAATILLGVALGISAAWIWAGEQPRKAVAVLAPTAIAVVALAVWAVTAKNSLLGLGPGMGQMVSLEAGVYVTLAGGLLALIAAALAFVAMVGGERQAEVDPDATVSDGAAP